MLLEDKGISETKCELSPFYIDCVESYYGSISGVDMW